MPDEDPIMAAGINSANAHASPDRDAPSGGGAFSGKGSNLHSQRERPSQRIPWSRPFRLGLRNLKLTDFLPTVPVPVLSLVCQNWALSCANTGGQ